MFPLAGHGACRRSRSVFGSAATVAVGVAAATSPFSVFAEDEPGLEGRLHTAFDVEHPSLPVGRDLRRSRRTCGTVLHDVPPSERVEPGRRVFPSERSEQQNAVGRGIPAIRPASISDPQRCLGHCPTPCGARPADPPERRAVLEARQRMRPPTEATWKPRPASGRRSARSRTAGS